MNLYYLEEHLNCLHYDRANSSIIEVVNVLAGENIVFTSRDDRIIFVLEGSLCFSLGKYTDCYLATGKALMLPSHYLFRGKANEKSLIISICITHRFQLCSCFPLEKLKMSINHKHNHELYYLDIKEPLLSYLLLINNCIGAKFRCNYFLDIKVKELLFILRGFYSKEDMSAFFYLYLNNDMHFSQQIYQNYQAVKNVEELAICLNYSYSGFTKRFKKVFGVPVYQWMKEQKAGRVYQEISVSNKSFKEIGLKYGFSSQAGFCDFCKAEFSLSPTQIRKNTKKGYILENIGENAENI